MTLHPMSGPSTGLNEIVVSISGEVDSSGRVMVSDGFGGEFEVDVVLPKGSGAPKPGERWLITKKLGRWSLAFCLERKNIPTIYGDRGELDPVVVQLLDVMVDRGLVIDGTTVSGEMPYPDYGDSTDPVLVLEDETEDWTYIAEPDLPTEDDFIPDDDPYYDYVQVAEVDPDDDSDGPRVKENPDTTNDPDNNETIKPPKDRSKKTSTFTVCTYDQDSGLGVERVSRDIKRLLKTRMDMLLVQSAGAAERRTIYEELLPDTWTMYRPTSQESSSTRVTIMWDSKVFAQIDEGVIVLCPASSPLPASVLSWVKVRHRESGQRITFANVSLDPWAAMGGAYKAGEWKSANLARYRTQMTNLGPAVAFLAQRSGAVILGGSFYCDYRTDSRKREAQLPYDILTSKRFRNIWQDLDVPALGTSGVKGALLDQLWYSNGGKPGALAPTWTKILRGYYSRQHRPLMATFKLKVVPDALRQ